MKLLWIMYRSGHSTSCVRHNWFLDDSHKVSRLNPSNAELNPIRHLLALVGARHIVHVSRMRVKSNLLSTRAVLFIELSFLDKHFIP